MAYAGIFLKNLQFGDENPIEVYRIIAPNTYVGKEGVL